MLCSNFLRENTSPFILPPYALETDQSKHPFKSPRSIVPELSDFNQPSFTIANQQPQQQKLTKEREQKQHPYKQATRQQQILEHLKRTQNQQNFVTDEYYKEYYKELERVNKTLLNQQSTTRKSIGGKKEKSSQKQSNLTSSETLNSLNKTPIDLTNNKFAETSRESAQSQISFNPTKMFKIHTPAANSSVKVAIIGGTGLDQDTSLFKEKRIIDLPVDARWGEPSDKQVIEGKISNTTVFLLARHGKEHNINPTNVNYRANIWGLKQLGCHIVLATTACGSLQLDLPPGHLVVLDQYIDR